MKNEKYESLPQTKSFYICWNLFNMGYWIFAIYLQSDEEHGLPDNPEWLCYELDDSRESKDQDGALVVWDHFRVRVWKERNPYITQDSSTQHTKGQPETNDNSYWVSKISWVKSVRISYITACTFIINTMQILTAMRHGSNNRSEVC